MTKTARQHVFDGMELLLEGLKPFVEKRLETYVGGPWQAWVMEEVNGLRLNSTGGVAWDLSGLLGTMMACWKDAFAKMLGPAERSYVSELKNVRNKLSHDEKFSYDDAERALDTMRRMLEAVSARAAAEKISVSRDTILRTKYAELARTEQRKSSRPSISVNTVAGLEPWRNVVEPHDDVAKGVFQQAEFAADLAKVHHGSAPSEYSDPVEFFSRTYLTDGLNTLLIGAAKRLSDAGGDPVVELQTNFGGGKTHSMLALYHMAGETAVRDLPGLDQLLSQEELDVPDQISRAVLVGTSRGPQDEFKPKGGPKIRTTWGELAWQLGGQEAFDLIKQNDVRGIAPGSNILEDIFRKCAPCLILIDEWVAYLRQIYKVDGLLSGSFDANLSFVQSLTEAVKASPRTLLVAALPASQIEVGGEGGQEALARLKQTFSRVESSWRPASQEESYEIVRRRLFKEIPGDKCPGRDNTLKQFAKLYRDNPNDFPRECTGEDYRRKLARAYPVHPDLFDHLYTGWGSLEKFQRTRGVLRLMAQAIHQLWMSEDPSVMIMPGSVEIGSPRVESELRHYLPNDAWQSIIAGDVDGEDSMPYSIDRSVPNLNRCSATRRVARAVFVATAPTEGQQNRGIDDKRIHVGVVQPGENVAIFGDALRRLTNQARFMHSDLGRFWYSLSPNLNRVAAERAGQIEEALVQVKLDKALGSYINGPENRDRGHFEAVQAVPEGSDDVPDEPGGIRAVVLGIAYPHSVRDESVAMDEAKHILHQRGNAPRVYRNTLVFLAADARQLDNLKNAMRASLAWDAIVDDAESLDLKASDIKLAEAKKEEWKETVTIRLRETWCYLIHPHQDTAQSELAFTASRISAQNGVLAQASKKLVDAEALLPEIGPERLNHELEKCIWQEKPHLYLKDLWEYLNRYPYLPRPKNRETLIKAVLASVAESQPGPFAYAERWDEQRQSYADLVIEGGKKVTIDGESVIVRAEVAEANRPQSATEEKGRDDDSIDPEPTPPPPPDPKPLPTRFTGTVMLSKDRPVHEMGQIMEGIVQQLVSLPKADVSLKLEITAEVSSGLDQAKVRTLMENATTLRFIDKSVK